MINGSSFDMGSGPDLKGTWKNYRTGEVLTIRDTIFEDNQLVGVATNGVMIPYNRLQSFVKCDPSEATTSTPVQTQKTHAPVKPFVDDIDNIYQDENIETPPTEVPDILNKSLSQVVTRPDAFSLGKKSDPAIEKVLDGLNKSECPKITVDLKWDTIPEGIMFLQKYLDKSASEIVSACINRYVDLDYVRGQLEKKLESALKKSLEPQKEVKKENKKTKS